MHRSLVVVALVACAPEKSASTSESAGASEGSTEPTSAGTGEPTGGGVVDACVRLGPGPDSPPGFHWSVNCGAPDDYWVLPKAAIASDDAVFFAIGVDDLVAEDLDATLNFGGADLPEQGGADVVLVRLDEGGQHAWSQLWGNAGHQYVGSMAAMGDGGVAVAIVTEPGDLGVGGQVISTTGMADSVLVVLDAAGQLLWSRVLANDPDTQPSDGSYISALASAPGGLLALVATIDGEVTLGADGPFVGGPGSETLLAVFEADGSLRRAEMHPYTRAVAIAADGSVALGADVTRLDPQGATLWQLEVGAAASVDRLAFAPNGDVVVAGSYWQIINLGGEDLSDPVALDDGEGPTASTFIVRFAAGGQHLWSHGRSDDEYPQIIPFALAVDAQDQTTAIYGENTAPTHIEVFDADGTSLTHTRLLAFGVSDGGVLTTDDSVVIAGSFVAPTDLGGGVVPLQGRRDLWLGRVVP